MTYYVTALTNDRAQLIVSETRTTDKAIAELVAEACRRMGHKVVVRSED